MLLTKRLLHISEELPVAFVLSVQPYQRKDQRKEEGTYKDADCMVAHVMYPSMVNQTFIRPNTRL